MSDSGDGNGVITQTNSSDIPRFVLSGPIDTAMAKSFIDFHTENVKRNVSEAFIYVDSPGGSVYSMNTIISMISNGEIAYHTIAMGHACSAACILTAFGTFRWAVEDCEFMFHDASYGIWGKQKEMEESLEVQKRFLERLVRKFAKQTNRSDKFWLDKAYAKYSSDLYFTAEEAVEYGVVDFIGMPTIIKQSPYVVELPVEMEDFEKIMKNRGVDTEDIGDHQTVGKPLKKTIKKTAKKRTTKQNTR
jgi:ATP-dependent Clp protease protease subunit